jgi:hypothetical protein
LIGGPLSVVRRQLSVVGGQFVFVVGLAMFASATDHWQLTTDH